jgi:DNA-binding winged helix-turn-helix (wHTH) protein
MRNGEVVPLNLNALETLRALVESAGTVLEKDALIKAVWPDTFVEESNLAHNISLLRKTLGSDPHERQYIQTIPKRRYWFIGDILEEFPAELRLNHLQNRLLPPSCARRCCLIEHDYGRSLRVVRCWRGR